MGYMPNVPFYANPLIVASLKNIKNKLPDEEVCWYVLKQILWKDGLLCPKCGAITKYHMRTRPRLLCCSNMQCKANWPITRNSPFYKSATPIEKWFYAIYLLENKGPYLMARELMRKIGLTYKSAWRMRNQIRPLLYDPAWKELLAIFQENTRWISWQIEKDRQTLVHKKSGRIGAEVYPLRIRKKKISRGKE